MGACQEGGSVIDWVMKTQGISFRHALEILKQDHFPLVAEIKPVKKTTVRQLTNEFSDEADDQKLLSEVIDYYHNTLKNTPEALSYLTNRGLQHSELIDHFKLGYANRTLGYRIPAKNRKSGQEIREQLQKIGILRSSGHEHFNGSLVIPIMDENNTVQEIYGRKIRDDLREGNAYHLYLPGPHKGIFNIKAFTAADEIILCESLIDALSFWVSGLRNVTCSYGVEGFTREILDALKMYSIKTIHIAYDRDAAGDRAAHKLSERLIQEGFSCYRVLFPKDMDANEYFKEKGPAAMESLVRNAQWLGGTHESSIDTAAIDIDPVDATIELPIEKATKEKEPNEAKHPSIEAQIKEHEIVIPLGERKYRVRGLHKNMSYEQIKVNLHVSCGNTYHIDTIDLYSARQRSGYIKHASHEMKIQEEIIKGDLGRVLLKLEELQDKQIKIALEPKKKEIQLTQEEKDQALALLKDPILINRILEDFDKRGVVGEECNKLVGYLACVSRKLDKPLAIVIQSTSAAGKSSLMDAILSLMPPEECMQYSAMTGQSLFYMGEVDLKHKILAIAEEEGAESASYALKLLQSDGGLTIASTGKDASTGKFVTQEYRIEGPVMIFLTTTAIEVDEELLNRCIVITVDEGWVQTQAIHEKQRTSKTLEGFLSSKEKDRLITLYRNAQRLIRPLAVINPYAQKLTFLSNKTRMRRDHMKYLDLIQAIALLHQYQRPIKTIKHQGENVEYIEVELQDIALANELSHEVLGRTLDELPPQTRKLLLLIEEMVFQACKEQNIDQKDYRFSRRNVREFCHWGNTQLKIHLQRLEEMEYLLVHKGGRGQSFVYELTYSGKGKDGSSFLLGLVDVEKLGYDKKKSPLFHKKSGLQSEKSVSSRPQVGFLKIHFRLSVKAKMRKKAVKSLKKDYSGW
jgi:DNA primase catalytic core